MNRNIKAIKWLKKHKKKILLVGAGAAVILATATGVKNRDAVAKIVNDLSGKIKDTNRYSNIWFKNASDTELETERELVRQAYCSAGDDFDLAAKLQNLLNLFDKEMSNRAWNGETPKAPSIHREHGWYLPNDD